MKEIILFNDNWHFYKDKNSSLFEEINLPHTWNNLDGQDGGSDYYRGTCFYQKNFEVSKEDLDKDVFLQIDACNSIANIYLNGEKIFHHEGGFSRFNVLLPLKEGNNEVVVEADNSANNYVYPQFADFTFFGGLYRNVRLIKVNKTHFDLSYFGGNGVKVTPEVIDNNGLLTVETYVKNPNNQDLVIEVFDNNQLIKKEVLKVDEYTKTEIKIDNVHLWNGLIDPFLYDVKVSLKDLDEVNLKIGFRTYYVYPNKGFFLNGKSYPLHGVSRHQDRLNKGWAISREDHKEDMELIKEVGANTIRLAHYQHDQYFYDLCDEVGMIVWAEIPYISSHMDDGKDNVFSQMKELIVQNYHHTSIICWGLSNEITMRGETPRLIQDHKELNQFVKEFDPTRLTTIANVSMTKMTSEMNHISDIVSYNHYFGWYAGNVSQNGPWLDKYHELNPNICLGLSEYGCEAILSWHSSEPKQGDYSEEYQAYYHEEMLKTFATRPYLWSTHVWNMFDFAADSRDEGGVKGRNNKGLVTYDRKTKKDSFYLYKAFWNNEDKFVHITSKRYKDRSEKEIIVKVYSNLDEVNLFVNDVEIPLFEKENHIFKFKVTLNDGDNKVLAKSLDFSDEAIFTKVENENLDYHFSGGSDNVTNWFENGKEMKFNFKEGYLNIESPIDDIMKNPIGKEMMKLLLSFGAKKMGFDSIDEGMLEMMGSMSISRIANLAGGKVISKKVLYNINEFLNKLKVDEKFDEVNENIVNVIINNKEYKLNCPLNHFNITTKFNKYFKNEIAFNLLNAVLSFKNIDLNNINFIKKVIIGKLSFDKIIAKMGANLNIELLEGVNNLLTKIKF